MSQLLLLFTKHFLLLLLLVQTILNVSHCCQNISRHGMIRRKAWGFKCFPTSSRWYKSATPASRPQKIKPKEKRGIFSVVPCNHFPQGSPLCMSQTTKSTTELDFVGDV